MTTKRPRLVGLALAALVGSCMMSCGGAPGADPDLAGHDGAARDSASNPPDSDECALALSAIGSSSRRLGAIGFRGNDTDELLAQLTHFAAAARQEAELLEGVTLDHEPLNAVMRSYAKMTRDVSDAADAMAQSVEQQNALAPELRRDPHAALQARMAKLERQQDAANDKLRRATAKEAPLLERLEQLCAR